MGLFSKGGSSKVNGWAQIVSTSRPPHNAVSGVCQMNVVLQAEGVPAIAVESTKLCRVSKWPRAGMQLPCVFDPSKPAFCARAGDDAVRDIFCGDNPPSIGSLEDIQNLLEVNPRGRAPNDPPDAFASMRAGVAVTGPARSAIRRSKRCTAFTSAAARASRLAAIRRYGSRRRSANHSTQPRLSGVLSCGSARTDAESATTSAAAAARNDLIGT